MSTINVEADARWTQPFLSAITKYLIKSAKTTLAGDTPDEFLFNVRMNAEATSTRQSAEWGMRALQASFPRLKDRFIYEENGERRIMMKVWLHLCNLRARRVGINQIRSMDLPALEVNVNEQFHDLY